MNGDEIIEGMAQDFSTHLSDLLHLNDAPADEFYDPITKALGDNPTQESVIDVYLDADGPRSIASELNSWLEIDEVTPEIAKDLLRLTIINNFGADSLPS